MVVLCGITPFNDNKVGATFVAGNHFPIGALLVLTLMVLGVNSVLRAVAPSKVFRPAELIAIWCMIVVSSGIPSSGLMRYLIPHMAAPLYFARPEFKWDEYVFPNLPNSLYLHNEDAVRWFFEARPVGEGIPWGVWTEPLVAWGLFTLALYGSFICLSVLIRRQWVQNERFTFPLVQMPVEMVQEPKQGQLVSDFFRAWPMWVGFGLIMALHTTNGLHKFFPAVPEMRLYVKNTWFVNKPWVFANPVRIEFFPLVIGFSFLLSREVCLSLWFFWLFYKMQCVVIGMLGYPMPGMTAGYGAFLFSSQEAAGAAIGLAGWSVWVARGHLRRVFRATFGGLTAFVAAPAESAARSPVAASAEDAESPRPRRARLRADDWDEPLSYRGAMIGFVVSSLFMVGWMMKMGVHLGMALPDIGMGFMVYVVLTWMVAQAGLLFLQPTFATSEVLINLTGSRVWSAQSLLVTSLVEHIFTMDLREFMLPSLVNAHKAADEVRLNRRSLLKAMCLAIVAGVAISGYAAIRLPYDEGGVTMTANSWTYIIAPQIPFKWAATLQQMPYETKPSNIAHFVGGIAGMYGMLLLRARFSWFPLHPVGFIVASGYPISRFWFSFLMGWLLKGLIMRYGGMSGYRHLRPFFLGLILGDCISGGIWIVVGLVTRVGYPVLPL